ncbi:MAG TPA: SBBP repeat-containing protein [Burkholderiales bacterium]|nr:SBBP repeat-containing protein [Burkholderiales bacterium]
MQALAILALSAFVSGALAGTVLVIRGAGNSPAADGLASQLTNAGHTVQTLDNVPESLTGYDQVWDLRFNNTQPITETERAQFVNYLASGKRMFVAGEYNIVMDRNNSVLALVSAAGGGALSYDEVASNINASTQTVQPPFTGPNIIADGNVTYAAAGKVANPPGSGQPITIDAAGLVSAIVFRVGDLDSAPNGVLIVVFDQNFMEAGRDSPDSQIFLANIIHYLGTPEVAVSEIANILPGLGRPFGVAVHQGYAYVADPESHTVWKVNLSDATDKTPVAGIGWNPEIDPQDWQGYNGDGIEATQAQLDNPSGVAVDSLGNIYIADTGTHAIRKIAAGSSFITTVAGIPTSYAVGESTQPACEDQGADLTQCIPATNLRLFGPRALAVDEDDDLYIVDRMNQQVKKLYTSGSLSGLIFVVAGVAGYPGDNDGPAAGPAFCTIDECTPAARLNSPVGVAVDGEGIVYIADEGNNRIRRVTLGGNVSTVQASPLLRPTGVAVSPGGGTLYIADYGNHRIRRATECFGEGCVVVTVAGTGTAGSSGGIGDPATSVQLNSPIALTLDGNLLYIADMLNGRILAGDFTPPVILLK